MQHLCRERSRGLNEIVLPLELRGQRMHPMPGGAASSLKMSDLG